MSRKKKSSDSKKELKPELLDAVSNRAHDGAMTCGEAFQLALEVGVSPRDVGWALDRQGIRIVMCQLGLFGGKRKGKTLQPAVRVSSVLGDALMDSRVDGRVPCSVAWTLGSRFKMPKAEVASACELLGIKIGPCQLGAF